MSLAETGELPRSRTMAQGSHTADELRRLSEMAHALDSQFRIPGTSIRFGWDAILGLVPGLGAAVTLVPAALQLRAGHRMGARKLTLARMAANAGFDVLIGAVPVIGDISDLFFKSNRRNLAILHREFGAQATQDS